jgi:D-sedoheptulose 7-phosphate isomerase
MNSEPVHIRKDQHIHTIRDTLNYSADLKRKVAETSSDTIYEMAVAIFEAFSNDNKLLICGNGGSASDAQHLATEFTIRFRSSVNRKALPAIALTSDTSALTAGSNDLGYDHVFARLTEAYGRPGDVLLGISTSGNSKSVVNAFSYARSHGLKTLALLGKDGGAILPLSDKAVVVPHFGDADRIQESHIAIGHVIIQLVEEFFGFA